LFRSSDEYTSSDPVIGWCFICLVSKEWLITSTTCEEEVRKPGRQTDEDEVKPHTLALSQQELLSRLVPHVEMRGRY
jgi:hypothetical protein